MTVYTTVECPSAPGRAIRELRSETGDTIEMQSRPMARAYRVTDPIALADRLRDGGFETRISTRGWKSIVTAFSPADNVGEKLTIGFLCAHDGRTAFSARPGVNVDGCANQFNLAPVKVWHTDPELDRILADPASFARSLLGLSRLTSDRLQRLRGRGDAHELLARLRPCPRLFNATRNAIGRYPDRDSETYFSAWSALQALTDTKSPRLVEAASLALQEPAYSDLWRSGAVPSTWDRLFPAVAN